MELRNQSILQEGGGEFFENFKVGGGCGNGCGTSSKKEKALLRVAEDSIDVPKNVRRGNKSTRTQSFKGDEVSDSTAEEEIEVPQNLRSGSNECEDRGVAIKCPKMWGEKGVQGPVRF